jgi:hypothetical protein
LNTRLQQEFLSILVNRRFRSPKTSAADVSVSDVEEYYRVVEGNARLRFIDPVEAAKIRVSNGVIGVDSSSRFVETPYFFLGIGAASAYDRILLESMDCPTISEWVRGISGSCKWLALAFNTGDSSEKIPNYILTRSPGGEPYDYNYNRLLMLSELRLLLEETILKKLGEKIRGRIIILDGPIYYVPKFIVRYEKNTGYYKSWLKITKSRIKVIDKLMNRGNIIIGLVKRLEYARILSRIDPYNLDGERLNDHAYLALLVSRIIREPKPFILGPVILESPEKTVELPRRYTYYVGIPRIRFILQPGNYVFFRFELLEDKEEYRRIILKDSIGSGSLLPLSNVIVDKRVKALTAFLRNYIVRLLEDAGVALTYDSMRSIEGLYNG